MNLEGAVGDQARQEKARQFHNAAKDRDAVGVVTDRTVRVFIRNIPNALIEKFDDQALVAELNEASENQITRYTMFTDKSTGRYTGQAMCTFATSEAAQKAIKALHGRSYNAPGEGPSDVVLELELAKEHGVVMTDKLRAFERDRRLFDQPWRHDRFKQQGEGGHSNFHGHRGGRGGGGFRGAGRGGRGGRGGGMNLEQLDDRLAQYQGSPGDGMF